MITPDYASPEQVRGVGANTATDVYSLGAILYELLTGTKVHKITSTDPGELEKAICETRPANPSAVVPEKLRRQLQGDLDNIVMKAMQKEPQRRYTSVDQFAEDIRAFLESRPVAARKDSLWYRTSKFARREKFKLAAAGAIAASLIGGIIIAESQARQARAARDTAVTAQQSAEGRLAQIVSVSNSSLSEVYARLERLPGALPARKQLVGSTVDLLEQLSKEAGNDVRVRVALARAYLKLGDLQGDPDKANIGDMQGALNSYRAGASLVGSKLVASKTGPETGPGDLDKLLLWAGLENQTAKVLTETGDRAAARNVLHAAIDAIAPLGDSAVRERAALCLSLSRALDSEDLPRALESAMQAVELASPASRKFPADTDLALLLSTAHTQVGYLNMRRGNPQGAEVPYAASMRIREQLARDHPGDILFRRYVRLAYEHYAALQGSPGNPNLGHPEIARAYYKKAQPLEEADRDDPGNNLARYDYAYFVLKASIVDVPPEGLAESLAALRECLATFEALSAEAPQMERYDRAMAIAREYMGHRLLALKRPAEARVEYQRALKLVHKILAQSPGDVIVQRQVASIEDGLSRAH
jgi:tetratricopeptide (TPR) repeat protein